MLRVRFLLVLAVFGCAQQPGLVSQGLAWERVSLSPSPFANLMFEQGSVYVDREGRRATNVPSLIKLYQAHGATEVYARIATSQKYPGGGDHTLATGLALAKAAVAAGLEFNPELGVFKFYGDVSCQPGPDFSGYPFPAPSTPWQQLSLGAMLPVLQDYGAYVAKRILDTGAQVEIWDLGNEVNFGFAGVAPRPLPGACPEEGPDWYRAPGVIDPAIGQMSVLELMQMPAPDRIAWLQSHVWPYEAQMLLALAKGIRSVDPGAKFATHITLPELTDDTLAFYRAMDAGGLHFDQLGLSVYVTSGPEADARWQGAQRTIVALGQEFGRPIFLAEVAYPSGRIWLGPFADWDHPVNGYPLNEQGQAKFLCQMVSWGAANGVIGIRPWAPEVVELGWSPMALFGSSGDVLMAKPALDALSPNCLKSLSMNGLAPETLAQPNHFFPGETDKQSVSFPGRD